MDLVYFQLALPLLLYVLHLLVLFENLTTLLIFVALFLLQVVPRGNEIQSSLILHRRHVVEWLRQSRRLRRLGGLLEPGALSPLTSLWRVAGAPVAIAGARAHTLRAGPAESVEVTDAACSRLSVLVSFIFVALL